MKLNSLQFSFGFSVFCHAVALGVCLFVAATRHESATLPPQAKLITLTLVAAPDEPVAKPEITKVEPVVTAPVEPPQPKPIIPVETKPAEAPIEPTKPPVAVEPKPTRPQPTQVHSDGSSPDPGLDATTQKAHVGIRAEPNYLKNPEPPYPLAARRRREQGLVLLAVKVSAQGRAVTVALKQSSGHPLLDEAALNAVRDWEFEPARVGALTVESEIEVPVRFKLTD